MRVAVAGGSGLVGRHVVSSLRAAKIDPVVLTRANGVDITTGEGLDDALADVDALIDVTNTPSMRKKEAIAFFEAGTRNLLRAEERAGVGRHIMLSIVGADRVDLGYYLGKRRQEAVARDSGRPVSILRTTQFFEFAEQLIDRGTGPVAVIPRMRIQPVAAREVAGALLELLSGPVGDPSPLAGPEPVELTDLAHGVLRARGSKKWILPVRAPGAVGRGLAGGALLPSAGARLGEQTFSEWLEDLTTVSTR